MATISQTIGFILYFQLTEPSVGKLHERFISFKRAGNMKKNYLKYPMGT